MSPSCIIVSGSSSTGLYRLAEKHTAKKIAAFAQEMWVSMGVRMMFFVAFRRPNGKITNGDFDFNDTLGNGRSYKTANPDTYRQAGISMTDWMQHNATYYDSSKKVAPGTSTLRSKKQLVHLEQNKYGEPMLQDPSIIPPGQKPREYRQNTLRSFISQHYGQIFIILANI